MFMRYARRRAAWRRSEIQSAIGTFGGLAFATLMAIVGLTAAAGAQPMDAEILARMLAAPQAALAPGDGGRFALLAVMGGSLLAMAGTCLMLWQSMIRDLEQGARARR